MREQAALAADRPPFKVLADATLVAMALAGPANVADLAAIPGCTPRVIGRWGRAILDAVARARALPDDALPVLSRPPRPPSLPTAVRRRIETLREWRATAAPELDLEPGVLLPNRLIRPIAEVAPHDVEALARVDGVRRWRVEVLGPQIVALMAQS
jgi:ribonuclease D